MATHPDDEYKDVFGGIWTEKKFKDTMVNVPGASFVSSVANWFWYLLILRDASNEREEPFFMLRYS